MSTNANPNGHIAIIFTYKGSALSYQEFLDTFYVTLPGGGGLQLGENQYYGYTSDTTKTITLGTSHALSAASSPITGLLPTNAAGNTTLQGAFQAWAQNQATSPGQTSYANLYLSHYTGGRVYLSNGNLGLGTSGEPVPASKDPAYDLVYGIFEPYIGAQVGSTAIPNNLADITDIDWFSFPITLKVWGYDFSEPSDDLTLMNTLRGGDGSNLYHALLIPGTTTTNQYPNPQLPAPDGSTTARRLAGPTAAAAAQSYYSDPAKSPFPYHYFDDYLIYLQQQQGKATSLFTLSGNFGGVGSDPGTDNLKPQTFSLTVDFSNIKTETMAYQDDKITPESTIVLSGYTSLLGSAATPFTITLPWAKGKPSYPLQADPKTSEQSDDAIQRRWLNLPSTTVPTAPSGTYSGSNNASVIAKDSKEEQINSISGITTMKLIYSVNSDPLGGADNLDNLYKDNKVKIKGLNDQTFTPKAVYTQPWQKNSSVILTIKADQEGKLDSITINDLGEPCSLEKDAKWTILAGAAGLGNNQRLTITLNEDPKLRNVFLLNSATYTEKPHTLSVPLKDGSKDGSKDVSHCTFDVTPAGLLQPEWVLDTTWTTLSQPGGIYGANAGYTIAGIEGSDADYNGDVKSLRNDVFGWIVADLLTALNTGLVGSPVTYPPTGKTIGESSDHWFKKGDNPYTKGLWGAQAWAGQNGSDDKPVTNFWNTWAYAIYTVPGGTDAYNFAFTDRFEESILINFNPPNNNPSGLQPVLLEVIVDDSPLLSNALKKAK